MSKRKAPQIRIPAPSQEAALDQLEESASSGRSTPSEAPVLKKKKSPPKKRAKGTGTLRATERGERLTLLIPDEVALRLRVFSATERRSMSDVVTAALDRFLPKQEKR